MENQIHTATSQKLTVSTIGRVDIVNIDDLVRIEGQSNYSKLIFSDGSTLVVAKVLKKFQEQLNPSLFIRAHKTHLVNLHFIRSYTGARHKTLLLENGENIDVSRSKQSFVMKHLMMMKAM